MTELTRKQRELKQREQLILSSAQDIWHTHGYNFLTMERLAESVEYSKGTIYNHFSSKEDIVCAVCSQYIRSLIEIFTRAANYPGTTRERYLAVGIGYSLYHQINTEAALNIQTIKSHSIREKISVEKLEEMESLEHQITSITNKIVLEALDCGDLPESARPYANNIVFGCWSMHYGALLLDKSDIPLDELGFNPVVKMLWENSIRFLDGYGWQPNSEQTDNNALLQKLSNALFADEIVKEALINYE